MTYLIRALHAEILKLNRTLALAMVFIAPLAVNLLAWFVILRSRGQSDAPWTQFANNTMFVWSVLMMPLFVTLETALLGGLDPGAADWKHLFALPIPPWTIFAATHI